MTVWVLGLYGFNLSGLLGSAVENTGKPLLDAGNQYGKTLTTKIDFLSLSLALVLGTAGLPHILMRFYTVPTAKEARRSVQWAIWIIGIFYLFTLVIGYGAAALLPRGTLHLGQRQRRGPAAGLPARRNPAARHHRGDRVRDDPRRGRRTDDHRRGLVRARHLRERDQGRGTPSPGMEVKVARRTALVVGVVAIVGGILANGQNVAFLVALAFAVAASANLPTLLYSLFWKKFNTTGALFSIYGGLAICILLIVFSPVVSGSADRDLR